MRWREETRSTNIEDRRSLGPSAAGIGGLGLVLVIILYLVTGVDPSALLQGMGSQAGSQQSVLTAEQQAQLADNVSLVLGDTETTWSGIFKDQLHRTYTDPDLVLFTGSVDSACGTASTAVGPFYCPDDEKVYLDLDFFYDLQEQYGAPGDFARAYVIAHEVGHHVQDLLGTLQVVDTEMSRTSDVEANRLSVDLELQADCYAGVWANQASQRNLSLESGDLEEGLNAASAVGDDRLQMESQGYVAPDTFTHGTSAQRVEWFRKGFDTGEVTACANPALPAIT